MNRDRLHATLRTLEHFTNDSLALKHHTQYLSGFHYNRDLLKAAVANTLSTPIEYFPKTPK